jgi:hypothetical protein
MKNEAALKQVDKSPYPSQYFWAVALAAITIH